MVTFIASLVLYFIREKYRSGYGIFEFLVGLIISFLVNPSSPEIITDPNLSLKILGGLYIMVRGLDNIVKGLEGRKQGIWLKENWGIGK
ncbi:hypothetical protein GCM10028805_48100 [Spirosoma harenae]